jgi:hypothetical protein
MTANSHPETSEVLLQSSSEAFLRSIARGGPFDVLDAIRAIAAYLTASPPPLEDPKTLALHLNSRLASLLAHAGYPTVDAVARATDYEIGEVEGIGPKALAFIRTRIPYARS